jgi:transposase
MDARKQKGEQLAKTVQIEKKDLDKWIVPSQTGSGAYTVNRFGENFKCSCPDFQTRGEACKHIYAVEIKVLRWFDNNGNSGTEITIRKTYAQGWPNYNKTQTHEKELFMNLLSDLSQDVEEPLYKFGRPQLPLKDMVFSSTLKVYTTFSLRRFISDLRTAKEKGYINQTCSYRSVSGYMQDEKLTPILQNLITLSALPLKAVETKFAIDSTGFRTTRFNEYCKEKHNTGRDHDWIKAHICSGVSTHIITGVEVLSENSGDSPQFIPLAEKTHNAGFTIDEMSADKAYSSRDNHAYIDQIGGTPFIAFRSNATGKPKGSNHIWRKMYNYFVYNRDDFLHHYHLRSNIESTNNMIKSKFTDLVRSKDKTAQINEILLKVLCHNICVLISEMFELGLKPEFLSA